RLLGRARLVLQVAELGGSRGKRGRAVQDGDRPVPLEQAQAFFFHAAAFGADQGRTRRGQMLGFAVVIGGDQLKRGFWRQGSLKGSGFWLPEREPARARKLAHGEEKKDLRLSTRKRPAHVTKVTYDDLYGWTGSPSLSPILTLAPSDHASLPPPGKPSNP